MPCHAHQGGPVVAPVLHELAGKLYRVPLHVVDTGGLGPLHRGEHVLEAMTKFVEEGFDLVEGHQAGGVANRWALVADQVGHRQHRLAAGAAGAAKAFIHPGSTALAARAAIGIKVKAGYGLPVRGFEHSEVAHVAMPDRRLSISCHYFYVE